MSFYNGRLIVSAAFSVVACLVAAQAGLADPLSSPTEPSLSQLNRSPEEGVPPVPTDVVRGRVTRVGGGRVTIETADGETHTYSIPAENENREGLEVGNEVTLSIRRDVVVAFYVLAPEQPARSTVIRRATNVQPRPAPAPIPAPTVTPRPAPVPAPAAVTPAPAPEPIRGMW